MDIRISREGRVPLREQIAAQIEFQIATGRMKPGQPLPSVRALARQLGIHHNTVSQAFRDVTSRNLLAGRRGGRMLVRAPEERPDTFRPELDDLINQTIRAARHYGYSLQELSSRVRERLIEEPPDHVLVLSFDVGMRRLLQAEIEQTVRCSVETCSPEELVARPELALGALVASPPGALAPVAEVLPKDRPPIRILYAPAEPHLDIVRKLAKPSIVAVASVSEHFLLIARGLLGPVVGTRHTLIECTLKEQETTRVPTADVLFCDTIAFRLLSARKNSRTAIEHKLISPECIEQITSAIATPEGCAV